MIGSRSSYGKNHAEGHGIERPGGEVKVADPVEAKVVRDDFLHCELIRDVGVDSLLQQVDGLFVSLDWYGPIIEKPVYNIRYWLGKIIDPMILTSMLILVRHPFQCPPAQSRLRLSIQCRFDGRADQHSGKSLVARALSGGK